jgi:hypothetical protein
MTEYRKLLESAYKRFHDLCEAGVATPYKHFSYDIQDEVRKASWSEAGAWVIPNTIGEAINELHSWRGRLRDWELWVRLKPEYDFNDWWTIQIHILEPILFFCMHQPSAFKDRMLLMTEFTLHQANLRLNGTYKDRLDQDRKTKGSWLSEGERKKQLSRMGYGWVNFRSLMDRIGKVNTKDYENKTSNYRNLSTHGFAPNFDHGYLMTVTREIVPWRNLVPQENGSIRFIDDPIKKALSYGFGEMSPLDSLATFKLNLEQYDEASKAFEAYICLVKEACTRLGPRDRRVEGG